MTKILDLTNNAISDLTTASSYVAVDKDGVTDTTVRVSLSDIIGENRKDGVDDGGVATGTLSINWDSGSNDSKQYSVTGDITGSGATPAISFSATRPGTYKLYLKVSENSSASPPTSPPYTIDWSNLGIDIDPVLPGKLNHITVYTFEYTRDSTWVLVDHREAPGEVNALEYGVKQGSGILATERQANAALLQRAADQGLSIYFPKGIYEVEGTVQYSAKEDVVIRGDGYGSEIRQFTVEVSLFQFIGSGDGFTVRDLKLIGTNVALGSVHDPSAGNESASTAIYVQDSNNIIIKDCHVRGFPGIACLVRGACQNVDVRNNLFSYNEQVWDSSTQNDADISVTGYGGDVGDNTGSATAATHIPRNILITGNRCLSNNKVGISCMSVTDDLIITNNQVVACNSNFAEMSTSSATPDSTKCKRKEGIVPQYYTTLSDSSRHERTIIVSDNIVRNTRWSGIYFNDNLTTNLVDNGGGATATITGNVIENFALYVSAASTNYAQNGITVMTAVNAVVNDNVIFSSSDPLNTSNASAVYISSSSQHTGESLTSTCNGNVIQGTDAGITISGTLAGAIVNNNHLQNISKCGIYYESDDANLVCDGNIFENTSQIQKAFDVRGGSSDAGNVVLSNNIVTGGGIYCTQKSTFLISNNVVENPLNRAVSVEATSGSVAHYSVTNNVFRLTEGTNTEVYWCFVDSQSGTFQITGNRFDTSSANLVGGSYSDGTAHTYCFHLSIWSDKWVGDFSHNYHVANSSESADKRGVRFEGLSTRTPNFCIKENNFEELKYGYFLGQYGSSNPNVVVLFEGGLFLNVERPTWVDQRSNILSGRWVANQAQTGTGFGSTLAEIFTDATPTYGLWTDGDRIYNTDPAVGSEKGWIYAPDSGVSGWRSIGNL